MPDHYQALEISAKILNYQNARIVIENVSVSFIQFLMFVLLPHWQQNVCHLVFEIRIRFWLRDIQQIDSPLGQHCEIELKTAQNSKSTFVRDLNLNSNNALLESLAHVNRNWGHLTVGHLTNTNLRWFIHIYDKISTLKSH